jgi:hypothetical protein
MDTYKFKVVMEVEVPAFNESDALSTVMDTYAVGDNCGTTVVDCEYQELGKKKK